MQVCQLQPHRTIPKLPYTTLRARERGPPRNGINSLAQGPVVSAQMTQSHENLSRRSDRNNGNRWHGNMDAFFAQSQSAAACVCAPGQRSSLMSQTALLNAFAPTAFKGSRGTLKRRGKERIQIWYRETCKNDRETSKRARLQGNVHEANATSDLTGEKA